MGKSEGSTSETARKRPERPWTGAARTMEVLRRCPLAIAQRLVHCATAVSTAVLGQSHKDNVRCTDVDEQLGQLKAKEVQPSQPSSTSVPTHDLFWANLRVCTIEVRTLEVPSSFVGKIYAYHRSEHSPGVRFCKYLLLHLLTGRHVCFSYLAFTFCPLPVSITLSNILSWTVCLPGLSDRFESEKDRPKTGYRVKEVHIKQ